VNLAARLGLFALLVLTLAGFGCSEATTTTATSINETPPQVLNPSAPGEAKGDSTKPEPPKAVKDVAPEAGSNAPEPVQPEKAPEASSSGCTEPAGEAADQPSSSAKVELITVKYDEMLARIAANKKAKFTIVDAWATWCGPCKENFPHLVEMNTKYAGQGLAVISLSLDDPSDAKAVVNAKKFLQEKKAVFTNFLLDEEQGAGFEKLNIIAIPAVFLYGPDGKEVKRFTLDDPNAQFTYEQVEQTVAALLQGKPLPEDKKAAK
jgi:thiol-disulfide isomerase/thioredoxin